MAEGTKRSLPIFVLPLCLVEPIFVGYICGQRFFACRDIVSGPLAPGPLALFVLEGVRVKGPRMIIFHSCFGYHVFGVLFHPIHRHNRCCSFVLMQAPNVRGS